MAWSVNDGWGHFKSPALDGAVFWPFAGLFVVGVIGNGAAHLQLRMSRPTRDTQYPTGPLFCLVSCPHYSFEVLTWASYTGASQTYGAAAFLLGTLITLLIWSRERHVKYGSRSCVAGGGAVAARVVGSHVRPFVCPQHRDVPRPPCRVPRTLRRYRSAIAGATGTRHTLTAVLTRAPCTQASGVPSYPLCFESCLLLAAAGGIGRMLTQPAAAWQAFQVGMTDRHTAGSTQVCRHKRTILVLDFEVRN